QAPRRRADVEPSREEVETENRQQNTDDDSEGRFHRAGDPERALSSAREAGTPHPARRAKYTGSRRTMSIPARRVRLPRWVREAGGALRPDGEGGDFGGDGLRVTAQSFEGLAKPLRRGQVGGDRR